MEVKDFVKRIRNVFVQYNRITVLTRMTNLMQLHKLLGHLVILFLQFENLHLLLNRSHKFATFREIYRNEKIFSFPGLESFI